MLLPFNVISRSSGNDCGRDTVRRCRLLMLYQEGPHQKKSYLFSKFCKQDCKLDYSRYCQEPLLTLYVITRKLLATHFLVRRACEEEIKKIKQK